MRQMLHFEPEYRVVAPSCAPVSTVEGLCRGIVAILGAEGLGRVSAHGSSCGGAMLQAVLRRYPDRVRRAVISHPGVSLVPASAGVMRLAAGMAPLLPARAFSRLILTGIMRVLPVGEEYRGMREYFSWLVRERIGKPDWVAFMRRSADFLGQRAAYGAADLAGWDGQIMLIIGASDPLMTPAARQVLLALYPQAIIHVFQDTGHAAALTQPHTYLELVGGFLHGPS